jgi:hypothetical protein
MHPAAEGGEAVSLRIQAERSDYTRAYRRQFWRSLGWLVVLGAGLALLPMMRASVFRAELAAGRWDAAASAAIAYLGAALFLAFMVELLARSFARYVLRKAPAALESHVLTFSKNGIDARGNHITWSEFSRVVETRSAFQLQLHTGQYMLLPRRQISSPAGLRRILREHLGTRAKLIRARNVSGDHA